MSNKDRVMGYSLNLGFRAALAAGGAVWLFMFAEGTVQTVLAAMMLVGGLVATIVAIIGYSAAMREDTEYYQDNSAEYDEYRDDQDDRGYQDGGY